GFVHAQPANVHSGENLINTHTGENLSNSTHTGENIINANAQTANVTTAHTGENLINANAQPAQTGENHFNAHTWKNIINTNDQPANVYKFVASNGWFSGWKSRFGMTSINLKGEKESNDAVAAESFKRNLTKVIAKYYKDPTKVYNVDKTGLCTNKLPTRTYASANALSRGGFKQPKTRISLLLGGNMAGEKLKPVVIGKAKRPRAFGNMQISSL
ncbi:unnamed protein product, partial [Meganyctiphanes norvegica]